MMGSRVIIAIDPGIQGALAVMIDGDLREVEDMPTYTEVISRATRRRVCGDTLDGLLRSLITSYIGPLDMAVVIIEEAGPHSKDGKLQCFTNGRGYGLLEGVVLGLRLARAYVRPAEWKRALKLTRNKDNSRKRAMQEFPGFREQFARVKDDGRAEAALIALWYHKEWSNF